MDRGAKRSIKESETTERLNSNSKVNIKQQWLLANIYFTDELYEIFKEDL